MILEILQECRAKAKSRGLEFSLPVPNEHPELGNYVTCFVDHAIADEIEKLLNQHSIAYTRHDQTFLTFFSVQEP